MPGWPGFGSWLRKLLDELRVSGIAVVLFFGYVVVSGALAGLPGTWFAPLLEYQENGQTVEVRADDGCLVYHRDTSSRGRDVVLTYCPARVPEGADGWAPQLKDFYTVDATNRTVTELVQFGIVPDQVARVRSTLPGGHVVDADTQRIGGIEHPVVLLHLRDVALPVDLAETDGRKVFVRLQLFDAAGEEVPVV